MKKTIKTSLQGSVFFMDDDAFNELSRYLEEIGNRLASQEERDEIIQDIETRIAEIFSDRLGGKREVVTRGDVTAVISLLGRPEDIIDAGSEEPSSAPGTPPAGTGPHKRLFRDPDNAVLGGVCGGLGAYFNIDPVWFRVAFIVLTFLYGSSILIYLLMWLIIPEAKTAAQRLEMAGQPVNLSNISKNISQEFHKVKNNLKTIPESDGYRRSRNALQEFVRVIGEILLVGLKILGILIGTVFVLTGLIILIALMGTFFFHFAYLTPHIHVASFFNLQDALAIFTRPENVPYILGSLALTVGIPLLALIYAGVKLIFNIRTRNRIAGAIVFVIWLISVVSLTFFIIDTASNYSKSARINEITPLNISPADTLFIKCTPDKRSMNDFFKIDDFHLFRSPGNNELAGRPYFKIVNAGHHNPELEIYRKALGATRRDAIEHAEDIVTTWKTGNNTLYIDPWYTYSQHWFGQTVDYTLRVPEGTVICVDEELYLHFAPIITDDGYISYDIPGKCWVMTEEGRLERAE